MSFFDEDAKGIKTQIESGSGGGMFIAQRLKDDGDICHCMPIENPINWREASTYKDDDGKNKMQTKWACNVARFDDDTLEYIEVCILECAGKRMGELWDAIEEFGKRKVYRIKRKGVKHDKQLTWRVDQVRDLRDEEVEMLKGLGKLEIRKGAQNDSYMNDFKAGMATELKRIGWSKNDWELANAHYFGGHKAPEDMAPLERDRVLDDLKLLVAGADHMKFMPSADATAPDLSEEADFF